METLSNHRPGLASRAIAWNQRYAQQAQWTAPLRRYLFTRPGLPEAWRVLEVGCGTGAVLSLLPAELNPHQLHGLDLDPAYLALAARQAPTTHLCQGDASRLPYAPASFDLTLCHYFLLWVRSPAQALAEMRRVTRPGGAVLALAEPDYAGRIDYPPELARIGALQAQALRSQGAEPNIGRQLGALFASAGLTAVEVGVLGGQWTAREADEQEWTTLRADLADVLPATELDRLQALDTAAWSRGERILFVPTFYALGTAP